jgi:hypothetical protein
MMNELCLCLITIKKNINRILNAILIELKDDIHFKITVLLLDYPTFQRYKYVHHFTILDIYDILSIIIIIIIYTDKIVENFNFY